EPHFVAEYDAEDLDADRFVEAWRRVVARHDMLRAIVSSDGTQRVLDHVPPAVVDVVDLRGRPQREVELTLAAVRSRLCDEGPEPDRFPPYEVRLTLLDARRTRIHFSISLLVCDGWSFRRVLMRELMHLYERTDADLPPLSLSYRDYIVALRAFSG